MAELLGLVTRFSRDVAQLVQGSETFESLLQLCRPAYAQFKIDIRLTMPQFRPFKDVYEEQRVPQSEVCEAAEEVKLPVPRYGVYAVEKVEQEAPRVLIVPSPTTSDPEHIGTSSTPVEPDGTTYDIPPALPMYLQDVRKHIERSVLIPML